MSVAIIAALPREIAGLVVGLKPNAELRRRGVYLFRKNGSVVVAAGMGRSRVTLAIDAAREATSIQTMISVGLAGSCSPEVRPGDLLEASLVIDALTGERFQGSSTGGSRVLVSTEGIASLSEKRRLHGSYGASMVDMEAATVARLARADGLGFQAIKGISDAHDFELADLSRFSDEQGHFKTLPFAAYTAVRPHTWTAAITLGRHSKAALALLTRRLSSLMNM